MPLLLEGYRRQWPRSRPSVSLRRSQSPQLDLAPSSTTTSLSSSFLPLSQTCGGLFELLYIMCLRILVLHVVFRRRCDQRRNHHRSWRWDHRTRSNSHCDFTSRKCLQQSELPSMLRTAIDKLPSIWSCRHGCGCWCQRIEPYTTRKPVEGSLDAPSDRWMVSMKAAEVSSCIRIHDEAAFLGILWVDDHRKEHLSH